jgi:MFS family permease
MPWPHPLRSLAHRDLRRFFAGQCLSLVGTWMQSVAQGWLAYRLTRSPQALGMVGFLSQAPVFLFGVYAGVLADRFPRRNLVLCTQVNAVVQAVLLAGLTLTGVVQPWHIFVLAAMLGMTYAFEIPARQALLAEIAGKDMGNAIALNSTIVNAARIVGPSLAGVVVALIGEGWCFALNALSFLGTIAALLAMRPTVPPAPPPGSRSRLLEGLAYARDTPMVRALLVLLTLSSFFGLPYVTLLPIFAAEVLHGGPTLLGTLNACAGAGAMLGAVALLGRKGIGGLGRWVPTGATLLGSGLVVLGLSRHPWLSGVALVCVGFGFISQMAGTMTLLQGLAPEGMRGRVMGLFSTLFVGMTPFGALTAGFLAAHLGAPATVLAGAAVVLAGSLGFHFLLPRLRRSRLAQEPTLFPAQVP